jgi:hypothetical protein
MGILSGLGSAETSFRAPFLLEGTYILEVLMCKADVSRDGVPYFLAEFNILKSNNPERPPGTQAAWFVGIKKDTPALGNIRQFIAAASDVGVEDVDDAAGELVVSTGQPLAGNLVIATASNIKTKKKGTDFTVVRYEPWKGSELEVAQFKRDAGFVK